MKTRFGKEAKHGDYVIATITYNDGWQSYGQSVAGKVSNGRAYTTIHGTITDEATIVIDKSLISEKDKADIAQNIEDYDFIKSNRRLQRIRNKKRKELTSNG